MTPEAQENRLKFQLFLTQVLVYFVFPLLALLVVIFLRPGMTFLGQLLYYFVCVYLVGGFYVLGSKIHEFRDLLFIAWKRKQWKSKDSMVVKFYKITIPDGADVSLSKMEQFFIDMWAVGAGIRTKYIMYTQGKWYYDVTFDVIIRGGKVEMYVSSVMKRFHIILKCFANYFPDLKLEECADPYENWPEKWSKKKGLGPYKDFHGTDFKLRASGLKGFANPDKFAKSDPSDYPMTKLLRSIKDFDPKATIILQYIFRPFENVHFKTWDKELTKIKQSIVEQSANAKDAISDSQKKMMDALQQKLWKNQYRTHMRLLVFFPDNKFFYGGIVEKFIKVFAKTIEGDNLLIKDWETASDQRYFKSTFGLIDSFIGAIWDKFYQTKENEYRKQVMYDGLRSRDVDIASDSMDFFLDTASLATLFHFPPTQFASEPVHEVNLTPSGPGTENETPRPEEIDEEEQKTTEADPTSFRKLRDLRIRAKEQGTETKPSQQIPSISPQSQHPQPKFYGQSQVPNID